MLASILYDVGKEKKNGRNILKKRLIIAHYIDENLARKALDELQPTYGTKKI